jgi:FKBP-type peptidyl-prolyl cis-trans isomerase FkpA
MFKSLTYALAFILFAIAVISCGGSRQKSEAGIDYIYHTKGDGKKPQNGDVITAHMMLYVKNKGKDSILRNTYNEPQPFAMPYQINPMADPIAKSMGMVSAGDSLTFFVPLDSLLKGAPRPAYIDSASEMRVVMKVIKIQSNEEYSKEMQAKMMEMQAEMQKKQEAQKPIDEEIIKKYVADNKLQATRTESGLYYVINTPGAGENPKQGENVAVHYTGYLLDGKKFDSSLDRGETLNFAHLSGQMIKGFDEGVAMLKKGGKATLLLPSHLAYGGQAAGGGAIPAFSVLRFEIELVDINPQPQGTTPTPQQ